MAKNQDIRKLCDMYGIEWLELATGLRMPLKDFVRRLNEKTVTPDFRRSVLKQIEKIKRRSEEFYYFGD